MNYVIRKRIIDDCSAIQHIITKSWNETYKGIVNDEFLNSLKNNEHERINNSISKFNEKDNNYLVLEIDSKVVGFVKYGASKDKKYGEINAIYILSEYKGMGLGRKLIESAVKELKKMNYNEYIIGCLDGNKANDFYKHLGGKLIDTRIFKNTGEDLKENVYLFKIK